MWLRRIEERVESRAGSVLIQRRGEEDVEGKKDEEQEKSWWGEVFYCSAPGCWCWCVVLLIGVLCLRTCWSGVLVAGFGHDDLTEGTV